jgi:hypothetical protein
LESRPQAALLLGQEYRKDLPKITSAMDTVEKMRALESHNAKFQALLFTRMGI